MLSTGTKVDRNQPGSAGINQYICDTKIVALNAPTECVPVPIWNRAKKIGTSCNPKCR